MPVLLGENQLAVNLAVTLQRLGLLIFPVRPPAVPEGTARFRLSLTADMQWSDLEDIAKLIASELARVKVGQ